MWVISFIFSRSIWIGYKATCYPPGAKESWAWIDNSTKYFDNWYHDQPDGESRSISYRTVEYCAAFYTGRNLKYFDTLCDKTKFYLCTHTNVGECHLM